jgi:nicotinate-nucleotide pyrophosphorylase (carboxylating)
MENIEVFEFFDRKDLLNLKNEKYNKYIRELFEIQLAEDLGDGDLTTDALISKKQDVIAQIISNQEGIIAGIEEGLQLANKENVNIIKKDGDKVSPGDLVLEIQGNASRIMGYERTLVNIIQRMSGIATLARKTIELARGKCLIAATRKTLPHLIDKKAVSLGGALTHRLNLNDFILIKDNHIAILGGDISKSLKLADQSNKSNFIEIEVKNEAEAMEAAKTIINLDSEKKFAIMFDNMDPSTIRSTINKINLISGKNIRILFEASGGIKKEKVADYSDTGVDIVSLGFLTHSAKAFDLSLEIK